MVESDGRLCTGPPGCTASLPSRFGAVIAGTSSPASSRNVHTSLSPSSNDLSKHIPLSGA